MSPFIMFGFSLAAALLVLASGYLALACQSRTEATDRDGIILGSLWAAGMMTLLISLIAMYIFA